MGPCTYVGGIAAAALAAFLWGIVFANTEILLGELDSLTLTALTFVLGSVLLSPTLCMLSWKDIQYHAMSDVGEFVICVLTSVGSLFTTFYSIELLGGINSAFLVDSFPLWTAVLVFVAEGERPSMAVSCGGILILTGVILIMMDSAHQEVVGSTPGYGVNLNQTDVE